MSETVTYKGKLRVFKENVNTTEEAYQILLPLLPERHDSEEDWISVEDGYVYIDNTIYQLLSKEDIQYDSIFQANYNDVGDIEYLVQYYNGGMGFTEALQDAIENIK